MFLLEDDCDISLYLLINMSNQHLKYQLKQNCATIFCFSPVYLFVEEEHLLFVC